MKVECIKDKLQEAVAKVDRITNKNATLPILSCILFVAKNNTVTVKSTNLDVGVEIIIPVKVVKEGVVALPGNVISSALANIKSNKLIIEEGNGFAKITSDTAVIQLKTLPPDDFPLIPRIDNSESHTVSVKDFIFGLKSVIFSASTSSIKPELGSVYIYHKDGQLTFVATDSFRLAEKKIPVKTPQPMPQILFPLKNSNEFLRIFDNLDEKITLITSKNQMSASTPSVYFTSRIVDGIFPDYEQIIPKEPTTNVILLKQDLADALKTTTTVVNKYNQVVFDVLTKKQQLIIKTKNSDIGEGEVVVKTKAIGEDITMSFNQKYLSDAIPSIPDDSLVCKFDGSHKPLVIEGISSKNFRYLVMPMNR